MALNLEKVEDILQVSVSRFIIEQTAPNSETLVAKGVFRVTESGIFHVTHYDVVFLL